MTKEEAIEKLRDAQCDYDLEKAHIVADGVLCDLLIAIGYADVVEEYNNVDKWYA